MVLHSTSSMRPLVETIAICLSVLVFCLLFLEAGLRIIGRAPSNVTEGVFEQDGDSYRLSKNAEKIINWPSFSYSIYTNAFGFRDVKKGNRVLAGTPYYMFMGASDVFANGVNYEDSFVGIFADEASHRGIAVLNTAVGGHGFLDQEAILRDFLTGSVHKPSRIFFFINDMTMHGFDSRRRGVLIKNGYILDRDNWRLAYLRLLIGNTSAAYSFFRDNIRKLSLKWISGDPFEASAQLLAIYAKGGRMYDDATIAQFEAYLTRFEQYCAANGIDIVYVYLPLSNSFYLNTLLARSGKDPKAYDISYYERLMARYSAKRGKRMISLAPVLREHHAKGMELRFAMDAHYNKPTNRFVGEYLIKDMFGDP